MEHIFGKWIPLQYLGSFLKIHMMMITEKEKVKYEEGSGRTAAKESQSRLRFAVNTDTYFWVSYTTTEGNFFLRF